MEEMGNAISALQLEVQWASWVALQNSVAFDYVLVTQGRYLDTG